MTAYTGVDNLGVMEVAHNYTAYLEGLVKEAGGGTRTALDFGAGIGTMAKALAREGWTVACVEPDERLRAGPLAAFRTYASTALVPSASAGYVYTLNVLEHIEDDRGALAELRRILQPGGRLLIYVPAMTVLWTAMDDKVGHVRRYHHRELVERVRGAGFEVERARYADSLGFAAALAYRLAGPGDGSLSRAGVGWYDRLGFPVSRRLDRLTGRWFGKNLVLRARAPGS